MSDQESDGDIDGKDMAELAAHVVSRIEALAQLRGGIHRPIGKVFSHVSEEIDLNWGKWRISLIRFKGGGCGECMITDTNERLRVFHSLMGDVLVCRKDRVTNEILPLIDKELVLDDLGRV